MNPNNLKPGDRFSYTGADTEGGYSYGVFYTTISINSENVIARIDKNNRVYNLSKHGKFKRLVKKQKLSKKDLAEAWNKSLRGQDLFVDVAEASTYFEVFCKALGF